MTVHDRRADDITDEVRRWLSREFADSLPESAVDEIVRSAHADLDGQIRPDAMGEMLHRLARFRVLRTLSARGL
ncbi:hypothetical protein [Amycolatopsis keratiniphila]|uniref:Uncharacterized protein n=1 Tax=Amycolatopsis keratiniphila subsp. keratiniphila TaxID=227715 RepID=A0A1W2M1V1_9PSEU|nr:hypothetical protein [Amycolatopsis keratiniphila]OLZ52734.1 hypothetical protein BS330_22855 [Amycolatopsis keratiniphila subsp. nogabecina]ONF73787.1 hypothetical protein AVR91_0206725 [Amycolatopsis keratiniphila subsp. keratiniphila]SDU09438.1 hypothetical protein SAMN04489733_1078 [Amycolatopsis keratiniphila]